MADQGSGQKGTAGDEAPDINDAAAKFDLGATPSSTAAAAGGGTGPGVATGVVENPDVNTRKTIAYFLLWILVGIMLAVVLVSLLFSIDCWRHDQCAQSQAALTMLTGAISPLFTAMVGLVGSVVGFYFGSKQAGS